MLKMEKEKLIEELEKHNWKVVEVARGYGVSRQRIYQLIEKFGIELPPRLHRVKVACLNCGKEIEVKKSVAKIQKRFFCSPECRKNYIYMELTCATCGKKFLKRKKEYEWHTGKHWQEALKEKHFCSKKCWGRYVGVNFSGWKKQRRGNERKADSSEGATASIEIQ